MSVTTSATLFRGVDRPGHRLGAGVAAQDRPGPVRGHGHVRMSCHPHHQPDEHLPDHRENPGRSRDRLTTAGLTFKAKDGYVVMAGVRSEERLRAMWKLVGREELMEDPRYLGKGADGDFWFQNVIPAIEGWSQQLSSGKSPKNSPGSVSPWASPKPSQTWTNALTWRRGRCSWTPVTRWTANSGR